MTWPMRFAAFATGRRIWIAIKTLEAVLRELEIIGEILWFIGFSPASRGMKSAAFATWPLMSTSG